jgi:pimeloyl-ACP methyl ester carboxylesterase/quercetin dioxygenase-like cupin family protein
MLAEGRIMHPRSLFRRTVILASLVGASHVGAQDLRRPHPDSLPNAMLVPVDSLRWEPRQGGPDQSQIAIVHVDQKTGATQLYFRMVPGFHVPRHWHTANETNVLVRGTFIVQHDGGERVTMKAGDFNFMPRRMIHQAWTDREETILFVSLDGRFDYHAASDSVSTSVLPIAPTAPEPAQAGAPAWTDPSPHRVRHVPVSKDVQLEVLDWGGTGPALVFLAGLGNTSHVFDDFAPRFRDRFHVYGITRRGFGASSAPTSGYDARTRALDIVTVLDSLRIGRAVLAGHSIAGDELSKVGVLHSARVRALVYLDAYDYGGVRIAGMRLVQDSLFSVLPQMTAADSTSPTTVAAFLRAQLTVGPIPESEVRASNAFGHSGRLTAPDPGGKVLANVLAGTETPDFHRLARPALGIFAVYHGPAAVLGNYDALDSTRRAQADRGFATFASWLKAGRERFRAELRDGSVVELSDVGHYVFLTAPDRVERLMRAFLARTR